MKAVRAWLAAAALIFLGATHRAGTYANEEFGFKVEILPGASTCGAEPPEHDHGINMYLDGAGYGCDRLAQRPHIGVIGDYNAAEESLREAVAVLRAANGAKRVTPPEGLLFPGRRSAVCRSDSADTAWSTFGS